MVKETQEQWVIKQLKRRGTISRNYALRHYVSRLAAHIADLKAAGMKIVAAKVENDYVYTLVK